MSTGRLGPPTRSRPCPSAMDGATAAFAPSGAGDLWRRVRVGTLPPAASAYWLGVAGIAAAACFVAVNRLLLVVMLRLGRGLSARATGLVNADDVSLEFVLALMAVPFAALWWHSGVLAVLSLAPLVLIHVTQRAQRG